MQPFVGFDIDFIPTLGIIVAGLAETAQSLEDVESLLEDAVDQVMIPSIHENFLQSGRPDSWEPLAEGTLTQRAAEGNDGPPLIRTGNLLSALLDPGSWEIIAFAGEGSATTTAEPAGAEYGAFHQTGTTFMPQREFLLFQQDDMERLEFLMGSWVDIQLLTGMW
jgi:phage gpG-like protein